MWSSDKSASWLKAWGEKLRSLKPHVSQISVSWTVIVLSPSEVDDKDQQKSREKKRELYVQTILAVLLHKGFTPSLPGPRPLLKVCV